MAIHEAGENYLEELLLLSRTKEKVRAIDLAAALGYARPTVSVMLQNLRRDGFIERLGDDSLLLTERGRAVAERIYERHCVLTDALMRLGVAREVASEDACKIEHDISDEAFDAIKKCLAAVDAAK